MSKTDSERGKRAYNTSSLPLFEPHAKSHSLENVLLTLYSEINNNWRLLTDVRFKLLGLVPSVSVVLLANLLSTDEAGKGLSSISKIVVASFGLIITFAIYLYDRRNSELYDDLISRARKIEAEIGMDTGQFLGRKSSVPLTIKGKVRKVLSINIRFKAFKRFKRRWKVSPLKPKYWLRLLTKPHKLTFVQHDVATNTIYWTTMLGYLLVILLIGAHIV